MTPTAPPPDPSDDWDLIWELFDALHALEPSEQTDELYARAPPHLHEQLRRLLDAHAESDAFLDRPLAEVAALTTQTPHIPAEELIGCDVGGHRLIRFLGLGASGCVYEAQQPSPRRRVALKLLHSWHQSTHTLARFEKEGHFLGRLQHPGIAQVHAIGWAEELTPPVPYLTMELVDGPHLVDHADQHELQAPARLALLAAVCDAVQHAHSKGVIHRDLKPANILVRRDGQPMVVDFGVARTLGEEMEWESLTQDGQRLGTPPFMSPEQLSGKPEDIDTRCDVYALGVIGFRLLAGELPFDIKGHSLANAIDVVCHQEPRRLTVVRPDLPSDVDTILATAMSRTPERRYATAAAFAADIRSFLSHQPISARPPSAAYVLSKFIARHRGLSTGLGVALTSLIIATFLSLRASSTQSSAREQERDARLRVELVADATAVEDLRDAVESFWPLGPSTVPVLERWLEQADELIARLPEYRDALAVHRMKALPASESDLMADTEHWEKRHAWVEETRRMVANATVVDSVHGRSDEALMGFSSVARFATTSNDKLAFRDHHVRTRAGARACYTYASSTDQWLDEELSALIQRTELLRQPSEPTYGPATQPVVEHLLDYARTLERSTLIDAASDWSDATSAISDTARSPAYRGLHLYPVLGLLPLGPDPDSGLWEFAHLPSGFPAVRDPQTGRLDLQESIGIVLVLLPGGMTCLGAEPSEGAHCSHNDPAATRDEGPVQRIELAPFMISKFEITQRQWLNVHAGSPATFDSYNQFDDETLLTGQHPIEAVSWRECTEYARRLGLTLPTEAQWEYAARSGSVTPWWCRVKALRESENLADARYLEWTALPPSLGEAWLDGHAIHAPVGSAAPNGFGLHDMLGNVREWCRDRFGYLGAHPREAASGEALIGPGGDRVIRGGSYRTLAFQARASRRTGQHNTTHRTDDLGVRLVLELPTR